MGCNPNQCDIADIVSGKAGGCYSLTDPAQMDGDQMMMDLAYEDLINLYGVPINYYINGFDTHKADTLYGEHTTATFYGPVEIKAYIEMVEGNLALSKFGFDSGDDLTAFLHIGTFNTLFGTLSVYPTNNQRPEPKPGDLIEVTALGCDRPGDRCAKLFEVTERMDQDVGQLNPLLGHYIYRLRAKRYVHTYETNAPHECGDDQVYDNVVAGKIESTLFPTLTTEPKVYPGSVDEQSQTEVYDMSKNCDNLYGGYY